MQHLLIVFTAVAIVASIGTSGCSVSPTEVPPGGEATPTRTPLGEEELKTPESAEATPEAALPYEARRVVELAKEDLARRLDISISEISVISVEAVDWPDTSLGCPQPGMAYAQVITPGYRVVLEADGQSYDYHTDSSRVMVWCDSDGDLPMKGTDGTVDDGWPSQPVDGGEVDISRITPVVPPP